MSKTTIRAGDAIRPPKVSSRDFAEAYRKLQARRPDKFPRARSTKERLQ